MSRDERKGKEKQIKGKIREEVGIIRGNRKEQLKGQVEQAEGKAREDIGKAKRKLKEH
jgi:uncharacterized protein YjbJ (UPF0337 family)